MSFLFQNHEGQRAIIQFSDKELKFDGWVAGIEDGCVKLSAAPKGGAIRYMPWPNANIVSIEFIPNK